MHIELTSNNQDAYCVQVNFDTSKFNIVLDRCINSSSSSSDNTYIESFLLWQLQGGNPEEYHISL